MRTSVLGAIAVSAFLFASPAAAEDQPQPEPRPLVEETPGQATATLASAEVLLPPERQKEAAEKPVERPRAKRITSCRCGAEATPQ